MLYLIPLAVAAVPSFILYLIIRSYYDAWQYSRKAAAWGCKPSAVRPHTWPLGLDIVKRAFDADAKNQLPNLMEQICFVDMAGAKTFRQYFFGSLVIHTYHPSNVQAILAHKFNDFELGRLRRDCFQPLLGNGIFTSDGKEWAHGRALLRPQFAKTQYADLDLEERHVEDIFKHFEIGADGWTRPTNLQPIFFRFTLDSATEFLFGESVQGQVAALPPGSPYRRDLTSATGLDLAKVSKAFDNATHGLGRRARLLDFNWMYNPKSFRDDCALVHKFADYYVNLALSTDPEKPSDSKRYIFLNELAKETRDPIELRSQLLNIFLAGRDTTAGLLGWVFWILARHPEIYNKLRGIILEEFGTHDEPRDITFSRLKTCTYLQHVLSETLRLYPSVPGNSRMATRDTTLPCGGGPDGQSPVFVPKGTPVDYTVHTMHRDPEFWGRDANVFNPERWVGRKVGWEFLPFNGGPRICLGQQFALTEAGYCVVRMLQRFDAIENLDADGMEGGKELYQYTVTTSPYEVNVRLHEAR